MAKFSIMLFGIDSYTKNKMQLPYKLDAKSSDAALREARMCAMTFYPRFRETEKPEQTFDDLNAEKDSEQQE